MLGSTAEAEDAVQEAWLRLDRADAAEIENLGGWLTTVVARVSLNMLRSRGVRREEPFAQDVPEPLVAPAEGPEPEQEALVADSVGLALMVVLETLGPAERLAFVLHDVFGVPFEEIAPMVDRSPAAARQLASRARRRVRSAAPEPDGALARSARGRRRVLRRRAGTATSTGWWPSWTPKSSCVSTSARGSRAPPRWPARLGCTADREARHATVNGAAGAVIFVDGRATAVMAFTVVAARIVAIDVVADPARVGRLDLSFLD